MAEGAARRRRRHGGGSVCNCALPESHLPATAPAAGPDRSRPAAGRTRRIRAPMTERGVHGGRSYLIDLISVRRRDRDRNIGAPCRGNLEERLSRATCRRPSDLRKGVPSAIVLDSPLGYGNCWSAFLVAPPGATFRSRVQYSTNSWPRDYLARSKEAARAGD